MRAFQNLKGQDSLMKQDTTNGLLGQRILVTRASGQNKKFSQELRAIGAVPIEFPTIQILPTNSPELGMAITNLSTYHWLIFTSVNGVTHFWQRLLTSGKNGADLSPLRLAAIGAATAKALQNYGLTVALMPDEYVAESLLETMGEVAGQRILLPVGDLARSTLAEGLQAKGATVDQVVAYQTKPVTDPANLLMLLPTIDILTFTSSSTVRNFVQLLPQARPPAATIGQAIVACIGPITAQTAHEVGLPVHVVAENYTIAGLVEALQFL